MKQNNYATRIGNAYIVYDLDNWPKVSFRNFTLKKLFGATNIVKNSDKEKYKYSGYGIAFDGKGSWNFGDDFARNVVIFGIDSNSSSHTDNQKNDFLILGESDTFGINGGFVTSEKNFSISFSKAKTKFCSSLYYNCDNNYLFVNGKELCKLKASNKNVNFPTQFSLAGISSKFDYVDVDEVSLKVNVYDFSVVYKATNKSDILNIHKYLMNKNNIQNVWIYQKNAYCIIN